MQETPPAGNSEPCAKPLPFRQLICSQLSSTAGGGRAGLILLALQKTPRWEESNQLPCLESPYIRSALGGYMGPFQNTSLESLYLVIFHLWSFLDCSLPPCPSPHSGICPLPFTSLTPLARNPAQKTEALQWKELNFPECLINISWKISAEITPDC